MRVQSFTALREQFEDISTKAVVLTLRGTSETRLTIALDKPSAKSLTFTLAELAESGEALILDQRSRNATVYMLTPTRILKAWGTGKRYQQAVPLAGIQSVTVQQSPVGRVLNYGTLVIESSEAGRARIVNVPRPREWEKAILEGRR